MTKEPSPLFAWRSAVVTSELSPTCRLVALTLSLHMNEQGGSCFPSIETLAAETGLTERAVQVNVGRLTEAGWVTVARGGGRGRSNRYTASTPTDSPKEKHRSSNGVSGVKGEPDALKGEPDDAKGCTTFTRGLQELSKEDVTTSSPPTPADDSVSPSATEIATERFETHFWPVWPRRHGRRVGKADALKHWLKLTVGQQRLAVKGAKVYAEHCERANQFPMDAHRWLRDRKWAEWLAPDDPPPAAAGIGSAAFLPNAGSLSLVPNTPELRAELGYDVGANAS